MAVVIDEYGGMTGIVTMYDLIEELVGELNEDTASEENDSFIRKIDEHNWEVKGNVELGTIENVVGIKFNSDEFDTFTGLIFDRLGEIPSDGDQDITVEIQELKVNIRNIREHQIEKATINV